MSKLRFRVVETAFKKKAATVETPAQRPGEYFAKYVFNREKMFKYLPSNVYAKLTDAMDNGAPLDRSIADEVAAGMKRWATELGVTHYTHWFQPLTEGTAEKHDAFVEHDGKGGMMEEFSGKLLVQQEPDASSFPNGGIRNTFEARGYSAWDPSSPVFVVDDTLCIPTVFIAYTGESLDYKAPLLKALSAVNKAAVDVCHYFNPEVKKVMAYLGWEQEYFLVDEGLYAARPDLLLTGRTLMGHEASKNQQLEDHYFGAIPTRVAAFMKDLEIQALELGIPVKTRHNEVAPNQFELAPIFEEFSKYYSDETAFEVHEGLPQYTGMKLSISSDAIYLDKLDKEVESYMKKDELVRCYAYLSGPILGYLLDKSTNEWHKHVDGNTDLGILVQNAYNIVLPTDKENHIRQRKACYDYDNIIAFENQRDSVRAIKKNELTALFTQNIKTLPLKNIQISFNPNTVVPLENIGTVYKNARIVDEWGILETIGNGTILITEDWKSVILPYANSIKVNNNVEETESWKLQLKVSNK